MSGEQREGGNTGNSTFQEFHVNGLVTRVEGSRGQLYLALTNANIPVDRLQDEATLASLRDWISANFQGAVSPIVYSFSGAYTLRHRETGELRTWTGSFSPRFLGSYSWSRQNVFNRNTFVAQSLRDTERGSVEDHLRLANPLSVWEFQELLSVIVSVNARLPASNRLVNQTAGAPQPGRARSRAYATFHVYLE